jgi:hypothetical protein
VLVDISAPNGNALLSERLRLLVRDSRGRTVYSGKLDALASLPLGRFAAGEARRYTFTVRMPDGGAPASATTGDNAYQGAAMSAAFRWIGASVAPASPASPAVRRDTTPPRLRVRIPRVQNVLRRRRLTVYVRCSERCRVRGRGSMAARSRRIPVRAASKRIAAHRRARLRFRLSRRALRVIRRRLRAGRRATIRLRITARDRAGNARTVIRRTHLRRVSR